MKFNKWTLGLAAVGVVSLASAARADEKMNSLQTALSNTTISGYVSASMNWQLAPGGGASEFSPAAAIPFQGAGFGNASTKQDGFNLDVVKLSIAKPEDESPWASGYQVDMLFGPDAVAYDAPANGADSNMSIKQAYITLRTPVGNGIDWKIGQFDTIIGYEVTDAGSNPNYTRSWGYAIEPVEHTGVLASYKVSDELSLSTGIANTLAVGINTRNTQSGFANGEGSYWHKTYMGSATYTAPASWGWAAGSSLYAGIVYGFGGNPGAYQQGNQVNYYGGATVNTPWKQLTAGIAFDYAQNLAAFGGLTLPSSPGFHVDAMTIGLYSTYKATDKLSFNARGEYFYGEANSTSSYLFSAEMIELTGTVEYDLWANVISRLELRWDRLVSGQFLLPKTDSVGLYANVIYKF